MCTFDFLSAPVLLTGFTVLLAVGTLVLVQWVVSPPIFLTQLVFSTHGISIRLYFFLRIIFNFKISINQKL